MNRRFFRDLARVDRRRQARGVDEVFRRRDAQGRYPRYYLQNFHYQTDGYLSAESAALYDYQVEILFSGGADAMRRQALVPLGDWLDGRRHGEVRLLDIGCGTGRFLRFAHDAFPRSEEHTSELQSLMRISYAVFCLKQQIQYT